MLLSLALVFGGLGYVVARTDAWGYGGNVLHAFVCAVGIDCAESQDALARAYGEELAGLVRRYSQNVAYEASSAELPIDFRRCRKLECSNGSDAPKRIGRSSAGLPVTAFTRVMDRRSAGGPLYIQYWFYYPESFTAGIGRIFGHRWPGYHADDWEGYQVRVAADGSVAARASAHGGYGSGWQPWRGWYWVHGGSHAGDVVGGAAGERTTPASELDLTPLETMHHVAGMHFEIDPPWAKGVYRDPESSGS